MDLFSNDPSEAMETAKDIIGGKFKVDHGFLADIATNRALGNWQRIAAIYALGFSGERRWAAPLRGILSDSTNDPELRSYAAEALGNLHDRDARMMLKDILGRGPQPVLRESCEYALEEIG